VVTFDEIRNLGTWVMVLGRYGVGLVHFAIGSICALTGRGFDGDQVPL
jgi:hypothetical protein